jgi:hypothetical protein
MKITTKSFKAEIKRIHPQLKLLSNYLGYRNKLKIKCLACGNVEEKYPGPIKSTGCKKCNSKTRNLSNYREQNKKLYLAKLKSLHKNKISLVGEYYSVNRKTKHKCNTCDRIWSPRPEHLLRGHGCGVCASTITEKEHKARLKEKHGSKIRLVTFKVPSKRPRSVYKCTKCKHIWETGNQTILKHGCPICASRNQTSSPNFYKDVIIKRKHFKVQGFEDRALKILTDVYNYKVSQIDTYSSGKVPYIKWEEAKGSRYHFPDIYIKKENLLIEVKSRATIGLCHFKKGSSKQKMFKRCKEKALASIAQGFNYKLMLIHSGHEVPMPKRWYLMTYREFSKAMKLM